MLKATFQVIKRWIPVPWKDFIKYRLLWMPRPNQMPRSLERAFEKALPPAEPVMDTLPASPITGQQVNASMLCRKEFFDRPFFKYWCHRIGWLAEREENAFFHHRKLWEFVYIAQTLYERNLLREGSRGLGFAVGREPLPALFASFGCDILATDLEMNQAASLGWVETAQHVGGDVETLNRNRICPPELFERRVAYRDVDMNAIPDDLAGFDFCWSSCAFEHLGSIAQGLAFVRNAMKTLRPGGIAIHTTELNLSSNDATIDDNPSFVLFRRRDMKRLIDTLQRDGHEVLPMDDDPGNDPVDRFVDLQPYYRRRMHLKLFLNGFVTTSFGLVIRKGM